MKRFVPALFVLFASMAFATSGPLARVEGQIAINTLVQRMPKLALASDKADWRFSLTLRGLERLPRLLLGQPCRG